MILKDYTKAEIRILKSGTQLGGFRLVWSAILRCLAFCGPVNRANRLTDSKSCGSTCSTPLDTKLDCHARACPTWLWACNEKCQNVIRRNYSATPDRHYICSAQMTCTDSPDPTTQRPATPTVPRARAHTHTQSPLVDLTYPLWRVGVRQSQRPAGLRSSGERREFGEQKHAK